MAMKDEFLSNARFNKVGILHMMSSVRAMNRVLEAGAPVTGDDVSNLIDMAERLGLVSRKGMRVSGLQYVVNESDLRTQDVLVREVAATTVNHILQQAERAQNIIHRKPGGYKPRSKPLYGKEVPGWEPLLP